MKTTKNLSRRQFIGSAAAASAAFTIVPRYVMGGQGYVAPSDKLTIAYIDCGTQGIREMASLITDPTVQIVTVCDPNKMSTNYVDWSPFEIRNLVRKATGEEKWGENLTGIPGGRDVGQYLVNKYYARTTNTPSYNGCTSYADFRELLEKEKDINAVKIMTPDHLHATVALAAFKKGKHVVTHKPIANRMKEARVLIDTAKKTGLSSHLLAWSKRPAYDVIKKMIQDGAIGTLKEIHNWSNRPVWPQWQTNPTENVPTPEGLDWQLWLGPVPDRPYHPNYTNAVFRGWYDFGAGSIADMGHYSLFPLFLTLGINSPAKSAEAYGTTTCTIDKQVSRGVRNDVAFPLSCIVRFKFDKQAELPPFDLFWYDGGMKPVVPDEMYALGKSFNAEGLMFVGTKGRIVGDFRGENPVLYADGKELPVKIENDQTERGNDVWINAFKSGVQAPGSFLYAGPVTETILLGGIALRARKRIDWNSEMMKITNNEDANKYLTRDYRPGWEI